MLTAILLKSKQNSPKPVRNGAKSQITQYWSLICFDLSTIAENDSERHKLRGIIKCCRTTQRYRIAKKSELQVKQTRSNPLPIKSIRLRWTIDSNEIILYFLKQNQRKRKNWAVEDLSKKLSSNSEHLKVSRFFWRAGTLCHTFWTINAPLL